MALERAVRGSPPYPSLAEFSREHGMHEQTIFHHFPKLSRELIGKRARSLERSRSLEARRIEASLRELIAQGLHTIRKDDVRSIAVSCKSSICQVRQAWKRLISRI